MPKYLCYWSPWWMMQQVGLCPENVPTVAGYLRVKTAPSEGSSPTVCKITSTYHLGDKQPRLRRLHVDVFEAVLYVCVEHMRTSHTFTMPCICLDVPCPCSFVSLAWSETLDGQQTKAGSNRKDKRKAMRA